MHTRCPSHSFPWAKSAKKKRWPKDRLVSLVSTPGEQQPFQFVLFHEQICTSCFTPSPHSDLLWALLLGTSSFWSDCNSQLFILSDIWIETSFYIISVAFLENYSFGYLYFHRHCGNYFLKGETWEMPHPVLEHSPVAVSACDVSHTCSALRSVNWCMIIVFRGRYSLSRWAVNYFSISYFSLYNKIQGNWRTDASLTCCVATKKWGWLGALGSCSHRGTFIHCSNGGVNYNWHMILSWMFFLITWLFKIQWFRLFLAMQISSCLCRIKSIFLLKSAHKMNNCVCKQLHKLCILQWKQRKVGLDGSWPLATGATVCPDVTWHIQEKQSHGEDSASLENGLFWNSKKCLQFSYYWTIMILL